MKKDRLSPTAEGIEKEFLRHCEEGWSPCSFAGKLHNTNIGFQLMLKVNEQARIINQKFKRQYRKGFQ